MKKIIFFGSGGGGNLKFIYEYFQSYNNLFKVVSVITDRFCGASEFALKNGIPLRIMSFNREKNEDKLLIDTINNFQPDIIITNIHKILSEQIVSEFKGKLINLHYSYLPAFGGIIGMTPVDLAIKRNNLFFGCTVHFVDEKVDNGITISQGMVIYKESNNLYQSVFECGAMTLLSGLYKLYGYDEINFKSIKEYLISPFTSKFDLDLSQKIILKLQTENDSI